jgi:hypothetical protein
MNFAAEIVVRNNAGTYLAGFASKTGKGEIIESFGSWYGSQMSYRPFRAAMARAEALAAALNRESIIHRCRDAVVAACSEARGTV